MELKNQVTSLKLSKRLRKLGVKQESLFYWFKCNYQGKHDFELQFTYKNGNLVLGKDSAFSYGHVFGRSLKKNIFSAFTCAELGEMLPDEWQVRWHNGWGIVERFGNILPDDWYDDWIFKGMKRNQETNARAKMLIYLRENKLVSAGRRQNDKKMV